MFTNRKDPLVDAVKSVMSEGNLKRQVEEAVNNHFGVSSRKAVPHEYLNEYDALLAEAYKCAMEEEKPISHPNQKIISKQDGNPESISRKDLSILRDNKKAGIAIKQEETQLDEKAVSKAQHRFFGLVRGIQKGQAHGSPAAEKAARKMSTKEVRKFAKTEEKGLPEKKVDKSNPTIKTNRPVKESVESIMEEIRSNLEEQLMEAYATGDSEVFENFVLSLTEEQLELLGLNEWILGVTTSPLGQRAIAAAAPIVRSGINAARSLARSAYGTLSGANAQQAAQTARTAQQAATATQQAARTAPTNMSRMAAGANAQQAAQTARTATDAARTAQQATTNARNIAGTAAVTAASAAIPSSSPRNTDSNDPGGRSYDAGPDSNDPGGRSYDAGPDSNDPGGRSYDAAPDSNDPGRRSYDAGPKQQSKPANPVTRQTTPTQKPAASTREKTPDLDAPNTVGGSFSGRRASELGFNESSHIRESLESFIRNRFIKG